MSWYSAHQLEVLEFHIWHCTVWNRATGMRLWTVQHQVITQTKLVTEEVKLIINPNRRVYHGVLLWQPVTQGDSRPVGFCLGDLSPRQWLFVFVLLCGFLNIDMKCPTDRLNRFMSPWCGKRLWWEYGWTFRLRHWGEHKAQSTGQSFTTTGQDYEI